MSTSSSTTQVPATELAAAVLETLAQRDEAVTVSQLRDRLPRRYKQPAEELRRTLDELAAQGKLHAWPAYRSNSPRFATRPMEEFARDVLTRLLNESAFTRSELLAVVRRQVPGLPEERCVVVLDEVLDRGQVRKLPPRLGANSHLLGTPHPRAYLAPLFQALGKSLSRLMPRLESEGISRAQVLEEARALWQKTVEQAETETAEGQSADEADAATARRESATPSGGEPGHQAAPSAPAGAGTASVAGANPGAIVDEMQRLNPAAGRGEPVSVGGLRRALRDRFPEKDSFDRAVLQLAREGRIELRRGGLPDHLTEEQRSEEAVQDPQGNLCDEIALKP
jgi:hypothetical protein